MYQKTVILTVKAFEKLHEPVISSENNVNNAHVVTE